MVLNREGGGIATLKLSVGEPMRPSLKNELKKIKIKREDGMGWKRMEMYMKKSIRKEQKIVLLSESF